MRFHEVGKNDVRWTGESRGGDVDGEALAGRQTAAVDDALRQKEALVGAARVAAQARARRRLAPFALPTSQLCC